ERMPRFTPSKRADVAGEDRPIVTDVVEIAVRADPDVEGSAGGSTQNWREPQASQVVWRFQRARESEPVPPVLKAACELAMKLAGGRRVENGTHTARPRQEISEVL